ncbi:hypothetical protein M422DRAFT_49570 [Sphaerobolus stellatus SS14]|uniref:Cytochrome b561 domain-containing protein n=1 Tax=Sphaerobolus stellatus (strain SS14) TaxID=990650 RepID=A0A0C9VN69_SPHS4|nr:hypothetical protein M422DRAFT_49570 [Sphaerobolus stellatus SS14]
MVQTRNFARLLLQALLFSSFVAAVPRGGNDKGGKGDGGGNDGNGNDTDGDNNNNTPAASNSTTGGSIPANNTLGAGLHGDSQCLGQLMCVTGFVNGSTVTYELQSTGSQKLGWMAIGFGGQMANTPMVILWPNTDGSITLSQRQAPAQIMPTVVSNPPFVATAAPSLSSLTGSQPRLVFTVPGGATKQTLIWAFGINNPSSSAVSAVLTQHINSGVFSLDLTKTLSATAAAGASGSNSTSTGGSQTIPFQVYQKTIIAHAAVVTFGFLFLLPSGVLLARYTRTWNNKWFTGHWILQSGIGGLFCIVGIILGFIAVHQHGVDIPSTHKTIGKILLVLYVLQCSLGAFIHFFKIRAFLRIGRQPQNYFHALLGLGIIGLSFYQVRLGYNQEWPNMTGRPVVPKAVTIAWIAYLVVLVAVYAVGLSFLPRQLHQEKTSRTKNFGGNNSNPRDDHEMHEQSPLHSRTGSNTY